MASDRMNDVKKGTESMARYVSVTDITRECIILYCACAAMHVIMAFCFMKLDIKIMMYESVAATIFYLAGVGVMHKSQHSRRWIFLFVIEFLVDVAVSNIVIGWGYGYSMYGVMIIPIVYYFFYLDSQNARSRTPRYIAIIDLVVIAITATIGCGYNLVPYVTEYAVLGIFRGNAMFSMIALIFYSGRFISEIYHKTEHLAYRADYDMLTGILNREGFINKAGKILRSNETAEYIIVCSDVKDFKMINDIYGDEVGDKVLVREAELLTKLAGPRAVAGRIGGDRFAICMPKENFNESEFVDSIVDMKKEFSTGYYQMFIYIGVYDVKDREEPVGNMCDKANMAIKCMKGNYQKAVAYYDEAILEEELNQKKLVAEFDRALENDEFCVFLQPQTDADGTCHGAEALVRWKHPKTGLMYPGSFVDCYERCGLIHKLDEYVWEQAVKTLRRWMDLGRNDLHISINISAKDFFYLDVYDVITGLVNKYGVDVRNLRLELTETAVVNENDNMEVIRKLHDAGFIIEIDDFGSGYSSLNMLKDICSDVLKIDREFLRETENAVRSRDILEEIIRLSNRMNMTVITEGVETREQVDMLTDMGCRVFQGYYFSKPIPIQEFETKYNVV